MSKTVDQQINELKVALGELETIQKSLKEINANIIVLEECIQHDHAVDFQMYHAMGKDTKRMSLNRKDVLVLMKNTRTAIELELNKRTASLQMYNTIMEGKTVNETD